MGPYTVNPQWALTVFHDPEQKPRKGIDWFLKTELVVELIPQLQCQQVMTLLILVKFPKKDPVCQMADGIQYA